jgi:hypothetical protein
VTDAPRFEDMGGEYTISSEIHYGVECYYWTNYLGTRGAYSSHEVAVEAAQAFLAEQEADRPRQAAWDEAEAEDLRRDEAARFLAKGNAIHRRLELWVAAPLVALLLVSTLVVAAAPSTPGHGAGLGAGLLGCLLVRLLRKKS